MPRNPLQFLEDIRQVCLDLRSGSRGRCLQDYRSDFMFRRAVERHFGIIGEALHQLLRLRPDLRPRITDADDIVAFRNQVVHGYWLLRDEEVWAILQRDVPTLLREVESLMQELQPPPAR